MRIACWLRYSPKSRRPATKPDLHPREACADYDCEMRPDCPMGNRDMKKVRTWVRPVHFYCWGFFTCSKTWDDTEYRKAIEDGTILVETVESLPEEA